jgi:hypothetical protein
MWNSQKQIFIFINVFVDERVEVDLVFYIASF